MTDPDLERLMRDGLERQASSVETDRAAEIVAGARSATPPRRRTPLVLGLAAASVAAVAVTGVVVTRDGDARRSGPDAVDPATSVPTGEWRTEFWRDLRVDVPADWGWGGAPQPDFVEVGAPASDRLIDCGAEAYVSADGTQILNGDEGVPYVGRPIMQTDACDGTLGVDNWRPPTAPYVWLGAPVEPGEVTFTNGYVMETREVNGSTVSVATKDAALRERILDSAAGGETCRADYDGAPEIVAVPREGIPEPTGMTVCAYAADDRGRAQLVYATEVDAEAVRAFRAATAAAAGVPCSTADAHEWALLTVHGEGGLRQDHLVTLGRCSGIELVPGGELVALTEQNVRPWAVRGIRTVLVGPWSPDRDQEWIYRYFRGILG